MADPDEKRQARRMLRPRRTIVGAPLSRPRTVETRQPGDFPSVSKAHLDLAKEFAKPLHIGPPLCDELVALVEHTFTEEEASLVRHLSLYTARSAEEVARRARRPVDEVELVLKRVAYGKFAIAGEGKRGGRRYRTLPVVPGMFEHVLVGCTPETMSPWHRRFAELFEALFETSYLQDYLLSQIEAVRFLPVGEAVDGHPAALPSDQLEPVVDRYKDFGVGHCQCRMTMQVTGRDCGRPVENCLVMGDWAKGGIHHGQLRRIERQEVLDIKAEAEQHGMVSWIINVDSPRGQISCSCCGCCCHLLRTVHEFNVPAVMAPPHFQPEIDRQSCNYCGKCARACPMGALAVDTKGKTYWHRPERCIGCGICAIACDKQHAIEMKPVPDYKVPRNSWFGLITRSAPSIVKNALTAYLRR
jgi:NAD-dependent dihydropyrimidine dehydrogenase PreA subunit